MSGYQRNGYNSDQNSVSSQDDHHYEVEHLATFAVSPQAGLVYPSDGMRRLLQMEKTSGIWTQKLYLRLESNWVVIVDYENGEVIEKFPIHLIRDPTAFTSSDPKEIYDNIFVFIVGEDPVTQNPPEMHIFQCVRVKATSLVEEMKGFMTGVKKGAIPPPPNAPPPEPPNSVRDLPPFGQSAVDHRADDASSTSSEKYERDVAVLNRCFDDIERFIARLQHAAAASRELDRRRRSRKSKKKDHGDGIMAVRARAPPEKDFVDTLQKFKLSFNLLAKLKAHIHDPNAPELVHFLFTPLALIIDASRDAQLEPNLPARVISPLLTTEAVELLTNCLTSKETELWHSLGEAWQIPREKWKGYVTPYHPVFADGWAPDYPVIEEKERANERYFYEAEQPAPSPMRRERSETPPSDAYRVSNRAGSDVSGDSMDRGGVEDVSERRQRLWIEELRKRDARIVQVTYPRTANNDKELTVVRGELLEVVDDSKNWWKCRNLRGQVAHVPHTIVTPYLFEDESFQPYHHQEARPGPSADWSKRQGRKDSDDSFSEDEDGLPSRTSRPQKQVPQKQVPQKKQNPLPPPPPLTRRDQLSESDSSSEEEEPPKRHGRKSSISSQETLIDELKTAVQRDGQLSLKIKKTQGAYVDHKSNISEVQKFLTAKKFSDDVKRKLRGKNGQDLFDMTKSDYVKLLGKEDGHRLESYITIQKNITQYKTLRTSELKLALQRARIRSGVSRSPSPEKAPKPVLPPPKKLFEYDSGSVASSPKSRRKREPSDSPPPERKPVRAPPPPPVTRNSRRDESPPRNNRERNGWRDSSESPPAARKPSKKREQIPPPPPPATRPNEKSNRSSRRDPSPPALAKRRDASPQKKTSRNGMANGWTDSSPSPPPVRKTTNRESSRNRENPKVQPSPQKNKVANGVPPKKKEEKRVPIAYQDSDSDAEPPAPGTLREQILKQRKRLSTVK